MLQICPIYPEEKLIFPSSMQHKVRLHLEGLRSSRPTDGHTPVRQSFQKSQQLTSLVTKNPDDKSSRLTFDVMIPSVRFSR